MKKEKSEPHNITTNRQAHRDYFVLETVEAGIVLFGCEVKSLREAKADFRGSFARIDKGEIFLHNLYITPYEKARQDGSLEPDRVRKLLLHRRQIIRLASKTQEQGLTVIPLRMYFNAKGIAKVELGVAKGKKNFDKRSDIKKATVGREMDRAMKNRNQKN